jgi:hypothetical protein
MEALLRQSKGMCPFLKKSSPATLRNLAATQSRIASPGGGTMSNLQVLGRRCPVMGKALTVASARHYHSKAALHTSPTKRATPTSHVVQKPQMGTFTMAEICERMRWLTFSKQNM